MQKILFLIMAFACLLACNDEDEIGFDVPVEFRKDLEFRPIPGGAVMKYYLPRNADIFGVRVRYNDVRGMQVLKEGTYLTDSLQLLGFNEAQENVPASVSFFNNNMVESAPMEVYFSTEDSAPVAFFDSLTVTPFWGGFSVVYRSPETVNGMAHVFYIGTNPLTHEPDSILMMSTPIVEGGDTLNFQLQQKQESTTVVVRTEDYRGYRVKQEIFEGLPCLYMDTLTPADFDFKFTGKVVENSEYQFGTQYLFDGDKKGKNYRNNRLNGDAYKYATFMAGPQAFGERFIIDLREERIPAAVRLYAFLNYETSWPQSGAYGKDYPPLLIEIWNRAYKTKLPCKVKLYGTNENPETVDLASCARLYDLDWETGRLAYRESWAQNTDDISYSKGDNMMTVTEAELDAADPVCLEMLCNYTGEAYRYLIFVVEDTFDGVGMFLIDEEQNGQEYITFNELEVSVKAE